MKRTYLKCSLCGHSVNQHNELGYCQSRPTELRGSYCICDGTTRSAYDGASLPAAHTQGAKP